MKVCTSCNRALELNEFSAQKTNKKRVYAWCDSCRATNSMHERPFNLQNSEYQKEMSLLREKAKSMRAFTPKQAEELRKRHTNGETIKAISLDTGRSATAVSRAIRGYR